MDTMDQSAFAAEKKSVASDFGKLVRLVRTNYRLPIEAACKEIKIEPSMLERIEAGTLPNAEVAGHLLHLLRIEGTWLGDNIWQSKEGFRVVFPRPVADEPVVEMRAIYRGLAVKESEEEIPDPPETVSDVIHKYADILDDIYQFRTAGDYTWVGLLNEFLNEVDVIDED